MLKTIDNATHNNAQFEVLEFEKLQGSDSVSSSEKLFFMKQTGVTAKMLKLTLNNSEAYFEPGALYFMKGNLKMESNARGGIVSGFMRRIATGETIFQTTVTGKGEVYLEPTLGHILLLEIEDEGLIVDSGTFCCASSGISVESSVQKNISSALFGGEGLFQTKLEGDGVVAIHSPVTADELMIISLEAGEKLSVDGNFAIARTKEVEFKAEKSGGSLFQTVTSGELLLQTFSGPGTVWLAPTAPIYDRIAKDNGVNATSQHTGSSGSST